MINRISPFQVTTTQPVQPKATNITNIQNENKTSFAETLKQSTNEINKAQLE